MHLRADLVNGRLRAECGGVGAAVSFHPKAAGPGSSGSTSVAQRAHQTVHVGLLKRFWFTLQRERGREGGDDDYETLIGFINKNEDFVLTSNLLYSLQSIFSCNITTLFIRLFQHIHYISQDIPIF